MKLPELKTLFNFQYGSWRLFYLRGQVFPHVDSSGNVTSLDWSIPDIPEPSTQDWIDIRTAYNIDQRIKRWERNHARAEELIRRYSIMINANAPITAGNTTLWETYIDDLWTIRKTNSGDPWAVVWPTLPSVEWAP